MDYLHHIFRNQWCYNKTSKKSKKIDQSFLMRKLDNIIMMSIAVGLSRS